MKNFSTRKIVLLSLIAVFALVYILQLTFTGKSKIVDLTISEDIDKIELTSANGSRTLTVEKKDSVWYAGEKKYPADTALVEALVKAVKNVKLLGVASASSSDAERYGLGDEDKIVVTAYNGSKLLRTLTVGKNTSTNSQCYVQADGKNAVNLASGPLHNTFSTDADKLRSKQVYSLDSAAVTKVSVKNAKGTFTIQKSAPQVDAASEEGITPALWLLSENTTSLSSAELDDTKVGQWINSLASLNVASWKDEQVPVNAAVTLTITAFGNDTVISLASYDDDSSEVSASSSSSPYGFTLSKSVAKRYDKALSDLVK